MESLCFEDREDKAVSFCACKFPLPAFCEKHAEEHLKKATGFHFLLPLAAHQVITSKQALLQTQDRLIRLSRNCDTLRERLEDFSQIEEHAEAVYQEKVQLAIDGKSKFKQEFAVVKEEFRAAVAKAINDTRIHALEAQSFAPTDSFSQLLWDHDPLYISTYPLYAIQTSTKEDFSRTFQIAVSFTIPGFEHWKAGQYIQPPGENEVQNMKIKDEPHLHEVNELRKELEVAVGNCMESERNNKELEQKIQKFEELHESAQRDINVLRQNLTAEEQHSSVLQKESSEKANQLSDLLANAESRNAELEKKVVEMNLKLVDEVRLTALQDENERLRYLANSRMAQFKIEDRTQATLQDFRSPSRFLIKCPICEDSLDISNSKEAFSMEGCVHAFHTECIKDYVNDKLATERVSEILTCPKRSCPGQIGNFERLVSAKRWNMYNIMLIEAKYKIAQCPNTNCREYYSIEGKCFNVTCRKCNVEFCTECMEAPHESSCYKTNIRRRISELEASGERVSQCPGCKIPYLNDKKCEHVKCMNPKCNTEFCFTCCCLRMSTIVHCNAWHRPDCSWYVSHGEDVEKLKANCPECVRLGKRCDPPKQLRMKCRFDDDEI